VSPVYYCSSQDIINTRAEMRKLVLYLVVISLVLILGFSCCTTSEKSHQNSLPGEQTPSFRIELPSRLRDFPEPLPPQEKAPGFKIRGIKGWGWTPEQYLSEIPYLVLGRMNFLMNCYLSMFTDPEKFINRWWEPIPEEKKAAFERVVRACQENGLQFCFCLNPQLFAERPFRYESQEDFELLFQHYAWMQRLGVRWFSLCFDDIPVEGLDKAGLGQWQALVANRLLRKLRERDPGASLIICPVYYWGCGEADEARLYLNSLGQALDSDIYVFWTGDAVVTTRITYDCAAAYKKIINHRLFIWDNYPVNDRHPVLHLGPVSGREPRLGEVADGYISNPMAYQNEINRLPLLTCADYAYNPWRYDPQRSIGQAILHLAESKAGRQVLKDLVELYPGNINLGQNYTSYNSVLARFEYLIKQPEGKDLASGFIRRVENVLERLNREFPDNYPATKKTIESDLAKMKAALK